MRRREFISLVGGIAATWPLAARAQPRRKVFRVGFLGLGTAGAWANRIEARRGGLRALGYVDALFDCGLISFSDTGKLLMSSTARK
jgi:putative ABC transport system substrate-binding protein